MRGRERGESGEGERTLRGKSLKAAQKLYPTSTSTTLYEIENENLHFTSQGAEARGNVEKKQRRGGGGGLRKSHKRYASLGSLLLNF